MELAEPGGESPRRGRITPLPQQLARPACPGIAPRPPATGVWGRAAGRCEGWGGWRWEGKSLGSGRDPSCSRLKPGRGFPRRRGVGTLVGFEGPGG